MQEYGLAIAILCLFGLGVLFFCVHSKFEIRRAETKIRALAEKRGWEIMTIRQDSRYGYGENVDPGSSSSRTVFNVTYKNENGKIMESVISAGFFGFDLEVEYEKAREG